MDTVDRIRELCQKNGMSITKLEAALGYGNGSISKAGTKAMRSDRLKAIADYFGVSMDYLLTGQEPEATWDGPSNLPAFTIGELQLLEIYKQLSEEKQADMIKFGQFLLSRQAEERKKTTELSKEA